MRSSDWKVSDSKLEPKSGFILTESEFQPESMTESVSYRYKPKLESSLLKNSSNLFETQKSNFSFVESENKEFSSLKFSESLPKNPPRKNESTFTFKAPTPSFNPTRLSDSYSATKLSSLMSPLRESELKASGENSSKIQSDYFKLPTTPVSEFFEKDDSSSLPKVGLTLDELGRSLENSLQKSTETGKFPKKGLTESWLQEGGIGYMPVIFQDSQYYTLNRSQALNIGETLVSSITLSGRSSQGGFQVYCDLRAAANSAVNSKATFVLKVGVSGSAVALTQYSALYTLVTPISAFKVSDLI